MCIQQQPEHLELRCPGYAERKDEDGNYCTCNRLVRVPFMRHATIEVRRTCQGCGARWRILVKPTCKPLVIDGERCGEFTIHDVSWVHRRLNER